MPRTIGRRWPGKRPAGDYTAECAYCGTPWRRSQLRMDGSGNLVCRLEGEGRDAVTQARDEADFTPYTPIPQDGGKLKLGE